MIKISPANFLNSTNALETLFVVEAVEYAINPYELINNNNIATNVFEVKFYNSTNKAMVNVADLK